MSVLQLLDAFRSLPPWGATDPGPTGWRRYQEAAALVQRADPAELDQALLEFLNEAEGQAGAANESRLFLLSRFVFDFQSVFLMWTTHDATWPKKLTASCME